MCFRILFCLFVSVSLSVQAQPINVRGKVLNHAGNGVSNAVLSLVRQGLKDTTSADGSYSFSNNTVVELPFLPPESERITLNKGVLEFVLNHSSAVKVEIFDIKGNLLKKDLAPDAVAGIYHFSIAGTPFASKLLVINASIGSSMETFRCFPMQNGKYASNYSNEKSPRMTGKLAKIAAIVDTIKTTASGYSANTTAISSYDTVVNITLDTAGASGHSRGCGTTPKLVKSTPPTKTSKPSGSKIDYNYVTIQGTQRRYILWYPDNYDNTQAYRFIICYHWYTGSASQVFDCTTEGINCYTTQIPFFNLLTISNNTTIFVAPEGLGPDTNSRGWANTNNQDLEFTDSILAQVKNNFCIDTTRIFACGFSYGGAMSYALAISRPTVFRAVGVYAGGAMSGGTDTKLPIAYYASHGISDGGIAGGRTARDHFVTINGCTQQTAPEPTAGSGTHICTKYTGCSAGHPVEWCAFDGGHDPSPKDKGQTTTWNAPETWAFFTQF